MMFRTHHALRLIVAGMALALLAVAAPAAQAQSVTGSGAHGSITNFDGRFSITVNAVTYANGRTDGNIHLTRTISIGFGKGSMSKEIYRVEALLVTGNQATVWARSKSDGLLYEFGFIDNGDGSVEPDYVSHPPYGGFVALSSGDITVTP